MSIVSLSLHRVWPFVSRAFSQPSPFQAGGSEALRQLSGLTLWVCSHALQHRNINRPCAALRAGRSSAILKFLNRAVPNVVAFCAANVNRDLLAGAMQRTFVTLFAFIQKAAPADRTDYASTSPACAATPAIAVPHTASVQIFFSTQYRFRQAST